MELHAALGYRKIAGGANVNTTPPYPVAVRHDQGRNTETALSRSLYPLSRLGGVFCKYGIYCQS
jgi:hypothetical protein